MKQLTVQTSTNRYPIYIGKGLRFQLKKLLPKSYSKIVIITDDTVGRLYLDEITNALTNEDVIATTIPSGEFSKNIEQFYHLQTFALQHYLDRHSLIIALGGGVIGDLAGFVAATFMRGIDYIQMPTTILAHDSSVGGKVAINHELGKNLIGAFYPPSAVIYDIDTLKSLPTHEVRSGYAEIVKEAYIAKRQLLEELFEINLSSLDEGTLANHLFEGIQIKANIVEQDEKESHMRKFLNFGHTLAHAIEAQLGYGEITHGEAVAIGMLFALYVSESEFAIDLDKNLYKSWLEKNNYPLSIKKLTTEQTIEKMKLDKKTENNEIQMVLLEKIGQPIIVQFSDAKITRYVDTFIKELKGQ